MNGRLHHLTGVHQKPPASLPLDVTYHVKLLSAQQFSKFVAEKFTIFYEILPTSIHV